MCNFLNSSQATVVVPTATSLQNLGNVWDDSPSIIDFDAMSLSFTWQVPPSAGLITQIRVSAVSTGTLFEISAYLNRFLRVLFLLIEAGCVIVLIVIFWQRLPF